MILSTSLVDTLLIVSWAFYTVSAIPESKQPGDTGNISYATIHNFAKADVLNGDDGLPPHPAAPLTYGPPALHVDVDGNVIEEHNARLFHVNGQYLMFTEKWACGRLSFFSGNVTGYPINKTFPAGDYGGECGIAIYSSTDLTRWSFETLVQPKNVTGSPTKPKLLYSAVTQNYVLWFKAGNELGRTGGLFYLTARSPFGPWSEAKVASGDHLAHDFDISQDSNGDYYIVTDASRGVFDPNSPGGSKPLWDVWVQKLLPNLTGVVGTNDTKVQVMEAADFQGIGISNTKGHWFITGGPTCGNCEVPIQYVSAQSPLGPWRTEDGTLSPFIKQGTTIAERGCGGQNKGLNKLPTSNGDVIISAIWGYRTSPVNLAITGKVQHGDNSQAISSTYWYPLEIDDKNRIKKFTCAPKVRIPLNDHPTKGKDDVPAAPVYQPDCRIRHNSELIQAGLKIERTSLRIPVFQRTDDEGPYAQAGPVIDAPLMVEVEYQGKMERSAFSFPASDISWAPEVIRIPLDKGLGHVKSVTLSTEATNGCYGVLAAEKREKRSSYTVIEGGKEKEAKNAQLYIHEEI